MAVQLINATPGTADSAPAGAAKINANFTELYAINGPMLAVSSYGGVGGSDITNALQATVNALPAVGGTVVVDTVGTIGAVNVNKPCAVQFVAGTYQLAPSANAGLVVGLDKRVAIQGLPGLRSVLQGSLAGQKLIQYTGLQAVPNDKKQTIVRDLVLDGNALADYAIYAPDNSGSFSILGQFKRFENLSVRNFQNSGTVAVWIGQSDYYLSFDLCSFLSNYSDIYTGLFTDTIIDRCILGQRQGGPGLICNGTQYRITSTSFGGGGGSGVGPDIRFTGTSGGTVYVAGCYFGPEGDVNTRNKVEMTQNFGANVFFDNNWFYGVAGQTCFKVTDNMSGWKFRSNSFATFAFVFDDSQGAVGDLGGLCDFDDSNTVFDFGAGVRTRLFKNGGRDFSKVVYPIQTPGITVPNRLIERVQNRLHYADGTYLAGVNAYSWNVNGAVTVTTGQTDPRGGTQAVLIADSATASDNWNTKVDTTNLLDDEGNAASGRNGRIVVKFSVKQGNSGSSPDILAFLCIDPATGGRYYGSTIALTPQWRTHEIVVTGIDPAATTCRLIFYPGGFNAASGSFYFAFPNVSDFGCSDFLPNNDTAMVDLVGNYDTIRVLANSATPKVIGGRNWRTGGTTTITNFLLGYENQVIRILAEHTVTLTHGGNLWFKAHANRNLVAGDTVSLIQKADGKWYEISGELSSTAKSPQLLSQSGIPLIIPPSGFMQADGTFILGQAPSSAATASFSATSGAGVTMTMSAATLLGTAADVGRVLTILDTTYKYAVITAQVSTTIATVTLTGTLSGTGPFANNVIWLSGSISNTAATVNTTAFSVPLPTAYPAGYAFFPATSPIGVAGVYYVIMASTTVGVAYNNLLASNTQPAVIGSPTPFSGLTPAAYTQSVSAQNLASCTVTANSMGLNGSLLFDTECSTSNTAGNKFSDFIFGASTQGVNWTTSDSASWQCRITNKGVANSQSFVIVPTSFGSSGVTQTGRLSQNTTADVLFSVRAAIGVATDFYVCEAYSLELRAN